MTAVNLPTESQRGKCDEVGVEGESPISTILIQHLFTNFVWAVAEHLPADCLPHDFNNAASDVNIEGRDKFDPQLLRQTYYLPKLHHKRLTTLVRRIENYGMGSSTDLLLYIVPAFSFHDLLPNQAILQLMPPLDHNQTPEVTAHYYIDLLAMSLRVDKPEPFCYAVVCYTMDFLYAAYQPFDERSRYSYDFKKATTDIVRELGTKFRAVVEALVPVHNLQGRRNGFHFIFTKHVEKPAKKDGTLNGFLDLYQNTSADMSEDYPSVALGFSVSHQKMYGWLKGNDEPFHMTGESLSIFAVWHCYDLTQSRTTQSKRLWLRTFLGGPHSTTAVSSLRAAGHGGVMTGTRTGGSTFHKTG